MTRHTPDLTALDALIFDLDETLYPYDALLTSEAFWHIFNTFAAQQNGIEVAEAAATTTAMRAAAAADDDLLQLWQQHGTFDIEAFQNRLDEVDLSTIKPCAVTQAFLAEAPVRKIVFTNAHLSHAKRVLAHMGVGQHIEYICDYNGRGRRVKPNPAIYHELVTRLGLDPARCLMVEDRHINLAPAHAMGMGTVLIYPENPGPIDYVDAWHPTLIDWIARISPAHAKCA